MAKENRQKNGATITRGRGLPGDPPRDRMVEQIIRVDHAGEYGAKRIYDGQLAVLEKDEVAPIIREMAKAEQKHLQTFDKLIVERRVRPTVLSPLWNVAGFALGAGSALLGARAAMACTAAVEEVIEEHYKEQSEKLGDDEIGLRVTLEEFGAEEEGGGGTKAAGPCLGQVPLGHAALPEEVQRGGSADRLPFCRQRVHTPRRTGGWKKPDRGALDPDAMPDHDGG